MDSWFLARNEKLNRHKLPSLLPIGVAAIGIFLSSSVKAADLTVGGTTNVVVWNNAALKAVRNTRFAPPMTARSLAILHTSIYDAWSAYDPVALGTQLGDTLQRPETENTFDNKNKAISYAAYRTLVDLFPSQVTQFNDLMVSLGYDPTEVSTDINTPTGIGNVAALALLDFRHYDGSNQLGDLNPGAYSDYTGYLPVNTPNQIVDPNRWQPLRVSSGPGGNANQQQYLVPHWGLVIPFALESGSQLRPTIGPKTTTSDPQGYIDQAQQILDIKASLTDTQKAIADYWSDGPSTETPPGHWNLFAHFVSERDDHNLDADVKMFFALNNALLDTSIAVWDIKRAFDSERPVTAIRYLFDENWQSYIPTPPFPEYVSGHSTFSAAAAEVLKQFTGSDTFEASYTQRAGTSRIEPGVAPTTDVTLSWNTFSAAADEAGVSRRYGGIHFEDGDLMGRTLGRKVAAIAWDKSQSYISPKSVPEPSAALGILALSALGAVALPKRGLKQ